MIIKYNYYSLRAVTNEPQSLQFHIQRVAVAIQRGNAAAILGSMGMGVSLVLYVIHFYFKNSMQRFSNGKRNAWTKIK